MSDGIVTRKIEDSFLRSVGDRTLIHLWGNADGPVCSRQ